MSGVARASAPLRAPTTPDGSRETTPAASAVGGGGPRDKRTTRRAPRIHPQKHLICYFVSGLNPIGCYSYRV